MAKKKKFSNNQNGESVDPELTNKLMQYLFGRNTNNPSILNVRSPNEYGVSFGDRFNIQSGLSFDPISSMPTGYGKVGINNKGFNLGLEKRKGFNEDATIFDLGYNNPNFNVNARYSNINNIPSIGGNIGYNNKGFNVGVAGNYSPDNKNISANLGYNKGGFNAGLNYDYSGQHSLSGNIGYSNDDYNVNLSGKYTPGDSNISLNTIYNLGKRKKQKAEPIPLAFNEPKEQINLIKENTNLNSIETDEAVGPPKKSNGGKITNMKKKKSNNLPKYFNGTPGVGNLFNVLSGLQQLGNNTVPQFDYSSLNNNPTLGNQNPNVSTNKNSDFSFKQMDNQNLKNMNVTGKGMSNMLGNATGPLGGVMKMLNGPLAPLAGMAMNSVTDMVDAIVTPERERRPVLQNAASYTFDNGGTIKIKPSKRGTFTAAAKKRGKGVQEFASQVLKNKDNYSPAMVKKANFARNAAKWKKAMGGIVEPEVFANGGLTGTYMDAFDAMAYGGMIDPSMYMQQMMYGSYAQGGQVPQNVPVEVEGEEMYEMPNGQVGEFQGAKHENGGMPMALPEGTKIYSDRLKVNGKTMAARKDKREANIAKLERLLTKNPNDKFLKEALKRQQETNALQEQGDMQQQEMANEQQAQQEMAMEQMLMGAAQQDMQEGMMMAMGGMIKRADGSYSKRGLWDNIRANKGSGKKPTKEMLKQERKIKRAEKAYGGMIKYADGGFVDNCPDGYEKDDNGNCIPIRESKMMGVYGRINEADNNPFFTQREYNETRDRLSKLQPQTTKITDAPLTSSEKFSSIIPTEMFDGRLMQIREDIEYDKNGNPMQVIYDEDIPRTINDFTIQQKLAALNKSPNAKISDFDKSNFPTTGENIIGIPDDTNEYLSQLGFFGQKGFANYPEGYGPKGKLPTEFTETPSTPDAPKKENRFMNFLNNAVDKTGDFFTGLFDKKGKPKTDRGTNTTNNSGDLTEGDRTGMFGTSVGMYGPALMTMLNRMETPPNVNFFNSFGQEALRTQEEAEGLAGISKDEAYRKNLMRANALRKQLVNSARGVNDIRSGQLSAALTEQEGARGILANYLQGMSGLKGQRAALQQQIDQTRMGGEQQRDLADRQDLDQFYTNLAENVANASNMMQKQGRDLNVVQYNKDIMSLSKAYSKYGVYAVRDPRSGLLTLAQKDANGKVVYLTEDEVKELPKKQPEIITTTVEEPKTSN